MELKDRCRNIWQRIVDSPAVLPTRVTFNPLKVHNSEETRIKLEPDNNYFVVHINQMYLTKERQWFSTFDPMVFIVTEFIYDTKEESIPFIVGPSLIEKFGKKIPLGMVFSNTRVAGPSPYRGDKLTLSVILYSVKHDNYAKKLLDIIENASKTFDFAGTVGLYLKAANIVLDAFEALLGLGEINPIVGLRKEFDPTSGNRIEPTYFALIDSPESDINIDTLWVKDKELVCGKSIDNTQPFREADFVLYSIGQTQTRDDIRTLPFYPLWKKAQTQAMEPLANYWKSTQSTMLNLYQNLMLSPDLIPSHASKLAQEYRQKIVSIHQGAIDEAKLTDRKGKEKEDQVLKDSLEMLNL